MSGNEIRQKYLAFMEKHGHAVIPSAALVPENDPTTLFTGSGMQPLVPYLMGEAHPKGARLADSQKCFRAEDIEEVGDNRHTTFFEMLGNWSLGDYFKAEQLPWFYTFLVEEVGLDPEKIYVTVFQGDEDANVPRDEESVAIWKELFAARGVSDGVAEMGSEEAGGVRGMQDGERIFYYDASKNWWSRAGKPENMPVGEIGGPDSEVFYDFGTEHDPAFGENCHPNCDCGRFLEIGNSVFMEYLKTEAGFEKLPTQNVDFGGGLERITAAANGDADVFTIDLLWPVIEQIEELSGSQYADNHEAFRVITDHIRGAVFMIGDSVLPSNAEQGYFVRRLLRRAVRYADALGIPAGEFPNLAESVIATYEAHYANLTMQRDTVKTAIAGEEEQFRKTLEKGLREFNKTLSVLTQWEGDAEANNQGTFMPPESIFKLITTHGFPRELVAEEAVKRGITLDDRTWTAVDALLAEHQEKSRAGAEQKFKGGLADQSEKVVEYHTTTHLMLAALRHFLGEHVHQAGSNITGERLRFDFTHPEKVERETLDEIETWVNNAIATGGDVTIETMAKSVAENDPTVEGSFWDRYPDEVKVYTITGKDGTIFSRELCGGPHVSKLEDIKGRFVIKKEESSSAGVRRIKAVLATD
ncbi:alanine--tRNA ligase [bacterium]|nr:alanine--tRNA ligase [bacterium]|tara:strand:+ start:6668 stop:8593 length:1926 start_codon:yes stop_codon:yes gene_type:complete